MPHLETGKRRVADRQFRNLQLTVASDDVSLDPPNVHSAGQELAELVLHWQDVSRATQLQDVDRIVLFPTTAAIGTSADTSRAVSVLLVLTVSSQFTTRSRARSTPAAR